MEAGYIACKHLALCLNEYVYNVCRTIPYRLFREKLQVLIPLCLLGCCGVDAICKAHKRTVFGHVALEWINQGFPLDYSCCLAAWRGLSCSHQSILSSFAENGASAHGGGCVVVMVEQMLKCGWSMAWGALWAVWLQAPALHTAGGLQKCGGCVLLGVTCALACGWHACYWTWHLKDGWLWTVSANPTVWELSFRKIVRILQTLSGLDGLSLLKYVLCWFLCELL